MIPASELRVLVGVYGISEANKKLIKFDADLKVLASSDPTVTLHAETDTAGFAQFEALKAAAGDPVTTMLKAQVDDLGWEEAAIKKAIFEDPATTTLRADVDDMGFAEATAMKDAFEDPVTTHLRAEATGFDTVIAQIDAVRTMAKTPITQEVKLEIDKSSLATLGTEETVIQNGGGNGGGSEGGGFLGGALAGAGAGGNGHGFLPTALWGNHGGGGGPWWMKAAMGGGLLAGAGSLGSFAGFGAEHALFTLGGVAGSAGAGALGGGLLGAGALGTMAVGGGSDMAVMASTIGDTKELTASYAKLQEQVALYGAHSKQAAKASAELHLQMKMLSAGGPGGGVKAELALGKEATALDKLWDKETQKARESAAQILSQVVGLGHTYVPLVAHAAEQNLSIVDQGLKPLMSWLEGPEGTGIFEHLEEEFAQNLPHAMHAFDEGVQFVLKTVNVASEYTGGFTEKLDEFFTKWNEPQNFAKWEGEIGHLVGDFHLWMSLIKNLGVDIYDLFSQDAHTGEGIVRTIDGMLVKLGEWERSTEGKEDLHNLFVLHKHEVIELLHLLPELVSAIEPIYMTMAPFLTEAMTEIIGDFGSFLKLLDETGPVTRWALGLTVIGAKLFGFKALFAPLGKAMWGPFESLLAKDPLIGRFFEEQVAETDGLTTSTEGLTAAVADLTTAYEAMGTAATTAGDEAAAAAAGTQMSLLAEPTAAEGAAAGAGQMSMFPMGSGLAPAAEKGAAGATVAEDVAGGGALAGIGLKLKGFADDAAGSIFGKAGAVAAGYFAAEFGAKLIAPGALEGQNLEQALLHGFNTDEVAKTEAKALAGSFLREINHALADGGEPSGLQGASHNRARTTSKEQTDAMRTEAGVLGALKSGMVTQMADIEHLAEEGSTAAAAAFGEGSPQWRKASADNMEAAIEAIKAGEHAGLITTEEGQHEIGHYLREYNLVSGDDPFHIASAFSHTWAQAGLVSNKGISEALGELRKMPPVAQAVAEQTMLRQVKEFERGGQLAKGTFSRLRSAIVTELQQTREHGGAQVELFTGELEGSFGGLSLNVAHALENIGANVGGLLEQLGAHNPLQSFTLHYLRGEGVSKGAGSKYLSQVPSLERQEGGFTIPGTADGDRHPMMLPYGSFIMNREATAAHGLQNGGHLPVLGESGERVFTPPEVAAVGARKLEWMNSSVPRFQEGGMLGAEPQLQGSQGALLTLGDAAIHMGYAAAQKYVQAHGSTGTAGGVNYVPGGGGSVAAEMWHVLHADGYNRIGAAGVIGDAGQESNLDPSSIGSGGGGLLGFTTGAISLAALQAFAKAQGKRWDDVGLQMQFYLLHENGIKAAMNSQPNAAAAAAYFMNNWEHPAVETENQAHREEVARWAFAQGYSGGGLVGQAERERGIEPTKTKTKAEKATPTMAVNWEMQHIGQSQPWDSENPGEWCGDFQADAMRSIGLTPPAGYSAAAAWANYGTPLGKGNMQAGAEIVYGHQHVAMALDSSKMISGNWGGVVATSPIEAAVEGTPITAVRWPEYGHGPGAGAAPTETVQGPYTKALSLGSSKVPKSLHGIAVEMHRWEGELQTYEQAVHLATGRPKNQHAIQANVTRIQKYLRELERARTKLRKEEAKKHYSHHLAKQLGKITGEEKNIERAEQGYEVAGQYAEQVVALEPTEPVLQPLPEEGTEQQIRQVEAANHTTELNYLHAYEAFVEGRERPAYERVLGAEAEWRNTILGAESKATGLEANWEGQLHSAEAIATDIPRHFEQMKKKVDKWRKKHPKAKHLPTTLGREWQDAQYEMTLLPELRFKEHGLETVLGEARQEFYPGFPKALQPPQPPLPGSGSFEQSMQEVQGIHWPAQHEHLTAAALAPPRHAGSFGGAIWDTQTAIEELGLNIQQAQSGIGSVAGAGASSTSAAESEHTQLLEELLQHANEEKVVRNIEVQTLAGGLPYAGGYESGGMVAALVGEQGPEIVATRPGSYIRTAGETSSLLSPKVVVNHYEAERRTEVEINDEKVEAVVNRMQRRGARTAGRGLARAGS